MCYHVMFEEEHIIILPNSPFSQPNNHNHVQRIIKYNGRASYQFKGARAYTTDYADHNVLF